jgi:succinate-semialdehyde dehydrogenase/glutarate-semialdehyde dehydrogenase
VVCAGGVVPGDGHYFAPVVLCDVPDQARVMCEEIFGPIAPICVFDTDDEAIARANDCGQGLAAHLFTEDLERAMRMGALPEAGMIGINRGRVSWASTSYGGVKHSRDGHSGGAEGIDEYLVTRYLSCPTRPRTQTQRQRRHRPRPPSVSEMSAAQALGHLRVHSGRGHPPTHPAA